MKKLLTILIIIPIIGFTQTKYDRFDELISNADNLKNNGYFEQAIEKYVNALDILTPNSSTTFFKIAECALILENISLADTWIRKGISKGGAQMEYLREFNGFSEIQEENFYLKIINDYNKLRQEYFSTIDNIDLYLEIQELIARDQFVRKTGLYLDGYSEIDFQNAGDNFMKAQRENDTTEINALKKIVFHKTNDKYIETTSELMKKVDSLNVARLMDITKKHGWQKRAFIILWHQRGTYKQDNYVWNYFRPLINKEIEEGKLSRRFWEPFDQFNEMIEEIINKTSDTIQSKGNRKKEIIISEDKIKG